MKLINFPWITEQSNNQNTKEKTRTHFVDVVADAVFAALEEDDVKFTLKESSSTSPVQSK